MYLLDIFFCIRNIPFSCPIFIVLTDFFLLIVCVYGRWRGELFIFSTLLLIYGAILITTGSFLSQLKRHCLGEALLLLQSKGATYSLSITKLYYCVSDSFVIIIIIIIFIFSFL